MKVERIAVIGDPHGCYEEFIELHDKLSWLSLDQIWTVGDLVDRGPDSGRVVSFCRERGILSVLGNHESSIINHWKRFKKSGELPKNSDKAKTIGELCQADIDHFEQMPILHVVDNLNLIIVHGGLWPRIPLYAQPINVCRAQLIHPQITSKTHWWGDDAPVHTGLSEEQLRQKGWERWYRLYDYEQDCVYGHSTWAQPMIHQNPGMGRTIGIDTGSCFGGAVTAAVFSQGAKNPLFVSVKARKLWYPGARRCFWEGD